MWAKIHIKMIQGDPDCEMITNETDWARLVKFILLELNAQKPLPLDPTYLQRKGFDLKKRPIELTLKMLHSFINIVSTTDTECIQDVTHIRVDIDKNRVEEIKNKNNSNIIPSQNDISTYFKDLSYPESEAVKFYDHFQSNGWKVGGKAPMKDWKAAARNWCRRLPPELKVKKYKPEDIPKREPIDPEGAKKIKDLIAQALKK